MFNKRLFFLVPKIIKYIFATVLCNWVCLLSNVVITLTICCFLQEILIAKNSIYPLFIITGIILLICSFIRYVFTKLYVKTSTISAQYSKKIIREKIYNHILKIGSSYPYYISTSKAVQISIEGVDQLEIYFGQYIPQLIYSIIAPLTLFLILAYINLYSALVLLLCVPIIPLSIIIVQRIAKKLFSKYWVSYTKLGDTFLENIQGLTTLKIYEADNQKQIEMNENAEQFRHATMQVLKMQLNSIAIMDLVAFGGAAAGIIVGILEFFKGHLPLFGVMAIILLSAEFFIPMRLLGSFFHIAMNGMAAADSIFKLLDTPCSDKGSDINPHHTNIHLKNISYCYEKNCPVLKNISLEIPSNTFCCIVGKSGCGKSTIASLLTGKLPNYKGEILIGDIPLSNYSEKSLLETITLVHHKSYIFKGTIEYNLKLGKSNATELEMLSALEEVNLLDFISSKQGLYTELLEEGNNLSGGQKQRLALARALLHNTPIYIFDEATSNIDAESEEIIMEVIRKLAKTKTVILISHRLANVITSDCIYVLEDGQIAEYGDHEELIKKQNTYANLFFTQKNLEKYGKGGIAL